ncbi:hypothetical protein N9K16_05330 [Alphaproteobacteria bacterium]|nr:hypothetical protein [Alphaproteobacteria bacterium]
MTNIKSVSLWKRAIIWALLLGLVFAVGRALSNDLPITVDYLVSSLTPWIIVGAPLYAILMSVMMKVRQD